MDSHTKEQIRRGFLRVYKATSYETISVKQICAEAHVSRSTFYSYYDSIHAVLEEIEDTLISELFAINEEFRYADFKRWKKGEPFVYARETIDCIQEHLETFQILLGRNDPRFLYHWKRIIRHHFREKFLLEGVQLQSQELILEMTASSLVGMYAYWVAHHDEVDVTELLNVALPRIFFDLLP